MLERMKLEGKIRTALRTPHAENSRSRVDMNTGNVPPGYGPAAARLWRAGLRPTASATTLVPSYPLTSAEYALSRGKGNGMMTNSSRVNLAEIVPGYEPRPYRPMPTTMTGLGGFEAPSMPTDFVYVSDPHGMSLPPVHTTNPGVSLVVRGPSGSSMGFVPAPKPAPAPAAFMPRPLDFGAGPFVSRAMSPARRELYDLMEMAPPGLPLAGNRGRTASRGASASGREASRGASRGASARGRGSKAGSKKRTQRKQRR